MTVPRKPCKKKVVPSAVRIGKEEKEFYADIYHSNKSIIDSNYILFQTLKKELVEIF